MTTTHTAQAEAKSYLRRLDRAARWLPRAQASELHEQIESHLAETLSPDVGQRELRKALAQLGEPSTLVREAAGPRRRLRTRLGRVRWWTWTVIGVLLAGLISTGTLVAVTLIPEYRAPDMVCGCGEAFTSPYDARHGRQINAGTFDATEIALRSSHQGFDFDVDNRSHVTQTILGLVGRPLFGFRNNYTLRIGNRDEQAPLTNMGYTTAPVDMRPGADRTVTLTWHNLECSAPGVEYTVTSVPLRVSVGSFTRTENIEIPPLIFKVPKPSTTTPATRCITAAHAGR